MDAGDRNRATGRDNDEGTARRKARSEAELVVRCRLESGDDLGGEKDAGGLAMFNLICELCAGRVSPPLTMRLQCAKKAPNITAHTITSYTHAHMTKRLMLTLHLYIVCI